MKIGIMTFHKSINYGSVLQAYALAYKLNEMGHDAEIINYQQRNYDYQYRIIKPPFSLEAIKHDFVNLNFYSIMKERAESFDRFRKKYLPLSSKDYKYGDNLSELDSIYDILICGSDQIWNTNASDFDTAYFFPFAKKTPRIAYAVSLNKGELFNFPKPDFLKKNILRFKAVSAREVSGQKKIENFTDGKKKIFTALDPTLLNYKEAYMKLAEKRIIKEPYIFFYSVNYVPEAVQAAVVLSEKCGLPVYTLVAGKGTRALYNMKKGGKIRILSKNIAPDNFLSLIRYADKVVTNSFHGTAFSIIFEKTFFSVRPVDENNNNTDDTRLFNILHFLGMDNHYVTVNELKNINSDIETDYSDVRKKRDILMKESIDFLTSNIG